MPEKDNTPSAQQPTPAVGKRASYTGSMLGDRYQIGREIGYGGMAVVYQAHDTVLDREVAIKVMQPTFTRDVSFERRFEREAKSAASLSNPYIVSVYDWGNKDGICYIVMELLRGENVKAILAENGPFDCRSTARIASQMCEALAEAHSKGIIHRDVKPQNIMVLGDGNTKLMDFGIARPNNSDLTTTAVVLGTAHYISPEQAQVGDIGPASDIYSLGIVMYECVTGKLPFEGDTSTAVALKQITEKPVPPSQINPLVDETMENIILKCMAKKPEQRFASATELRNVLGAYMRGQNVVVASPSFTQAETVAIPPVAAGTAPTQVMGNAMPIVPPMHVDPENKNFKEYKGTEEEEPGFWTTPKKVALGIAIALLAILLGWGIGTALVGGQEPVNDNANNNNNVANENKNENGNENENKEKNTAKEVPGLVGKTRDQAVFAIESAGFRIEVAEAYSEEVDEGCVISQEPAAGTKLEPGGYVKIVVSKGSEMVDVPNVVGMSSGNAQAALINAGLMIGEIAEEESSQESGTVIRQSTNDRVMRGTAVDLVVSAGVKKVNIPGVVGKTLAQAYAELSGFQVVVDGSNDPEAIVTGQTTGQIDAGGVVTLTTKEPPHNTNNENGNGNQNSNDNGNQNQGGNDNNNGNGNSDENDNNADSGPEAENQEA